MGDEMLLCLQMDIPVQIILSIDQSKSGEESLSSLEIDSVRYPTFFIKLKKAAAICKQ